MNVNEQYELVQYIISKNQDGYLTPDEFNLTANPAQDGFMSFLIGQVVQYQYGRPIPRVELGNSEQLIQKVSTFIPPNVTLTIDGSGLAAYPIDHTQTIAMLTTTFDRVRFVQQDSLYSYIKSVIDPVQQNPIYSIESDGFRFVPNTLGSALLTYIRTPKRIKWAYTLDINQRPVYDPTLSVDPEWYDIDMMDVIVRQLAMVGVNLQAPQVMQYAQQIKAQGQ